MHETLYTYLLYPLGWAMGCQWWIFWRELTMIWWNSTVFIQLSFIKTWLIFSKILVWRWFLIMIESRSLSVLVHSITNFVAAVVAPLRRLTSLLLDGRVKKCQSSQLPLDTADPALKYSTKHYCFLENESGDKRETIGLPTTGLPYKIWL